jgi:hypothetical protein
MSDVTRFELLLLGALERSKPPSEKELAEDARRYAAPDRALGEVRTRVVETLTALRERGLVTERRKLTDAGRASVRGALGLARMPAWQELRTHAAALALGRVPGSIEAQRTLASSATLQASILASRFELAPTTDLRAVCELLLFGRLQLPAFTIRDKRLLTRVLAHHAGVEPNGDLEQVAARIAASIVGARNGSKRALVDALARQWLRDASPTRKATLDDAVRDALTRVPPSGRFGEHKIFIVSLWEALASDARAGGIDLAAFKRWLLEANAKQSIVLARADLVGAMDPTRVAASEILDRGASFHFVLDNQ